MYFNTYLLYYYEECDFIIDIRYFRRSKSSESNIIFPFYAVIQNSLAFMASESRVGSIDDQLYTRWACDSRNWASRPSFLPVRFFPIMSLVKENETKEETASTDKDARQRAGGWIQRTEGKRIDWWSLLVPNAVSKD